MKKGTKVTIPTSELGVKGGVPIVGIVTHGWQDVIQVDFDGHLGQYTKAKHQINVVEE